jgi:hypothetical protein
MGLFLSSLTEFYDFLVCTDMTSEHNSEVITLIAINQKNFKQLLIVWNFAPK